MNIRVRLGLVVAFLVVGASSRLLLARQLDAMDAASSKQLTRPLSQFPSRIGEWFGRDEPPKPEILAMMKLDDHLQRVYRHPSGQEVVLWISFSRTSRDQYHYPTVCMQGSGWSEEESERVVQPTPVRTSGEPTSRTRFRFVREDRGRQYVYYWYYLIGEGSVDRAMRKLSRSARLFLRGRSNASATVEIFSQSSSPDPSMMDRFADDVARALDDWMPPGSRAQSELGAGN